MNQREAWQYELDLAAKNLTDYLKHLASIDVANGSSSEMNVRVMSLYERGRKLLADTTIAQGKTRWMDE